MLESSPQWPQQVKASFDGIYNALHCFFGTQIETEKANEPMNDHNFEYTWKS